MQVNVHGTAAGNVRNDFTRSSQAEDSSEVKLMRARARVKELERRHAEAHSKFKAAIEDENGTHDLQALKSNVHSLARELEAASDEASMLEGQQMQQKLGRLPALIEETRAKREDFIRLYRATCAALGDYCGKVGETLELVNLEMRVNALNYSPHRKEVSELATMPRPLEGFAHQPCTHIGYNWQIAIVPINSSAKGDR